MRLQSLPKVLGPMALACAWAVAQEPPAAPAEPSENTTQLEPAKPIQEIPADQSQPPAAPETAPAPADQTPAVETPIVPIEGDAPAVIEDPNLPPVQPVPLEGSAVTDGTVGPPPELSGEAVDPTLGEAGSASNLLSGSDADAMRDLDVATPDILNNDRPWLRGLSFGGSFTALYDTNVYLSSGLGSLPKTDDFVFGFKPFIAYGSEKYGLNYTAKLVLDGEEYADNSRLSGVSYVADFSMGYGGKRFTGQLELSQALDASVDRNYGDYVERNIFKIDGKLTYRISEKTSVEGRAGYNSIAPKDPRFFDTSKDFLNIAMVWQATPLLNLAGGLGVATAQGDRQLDRDTIGPILRANYELSKKVSIETDLGVDFVSYGGGKGVSSGSGSGSSDTFIAAQITAKYVPSPFWSFDLSLVRDSEPDGSIPGAYRDVTGIRGSVRKKISKAVVALGLGYEQDTYTRPGGGSSIAGLDRDYYTFDLSVTQPIYKDIVELQVFTKYRSQEADTALHTWSGTQYGIGLQSSF